MNLLIDTTVPIVACTSPDFPHGALGASGDRHLVDGVRYLCSRIWTDAEGRDRVGAVLVSAEQIFAARDVQKADARPGGYVATGGHGGIVGTMGEPGPPVLTYLPVWRHTHESAVRLSLLPTEVRGVRASASRLETVPVAVRDARAVFPEARHNASAAPTSPSDAIMATVRSMARGAVPVPDGVSEPTVIRSSIPRSRTRRMKSRVQRGFPA